VLFHLPEGTKPVTTYDSNGSAAGGATTFAMLPTNLSGFPHGLSGHSGPAKCATIAAGVPAEFDPLRTSAFARRGVRKSKKNRNRRSYHDPDLCTASDTLMVAGMSPISLKVSAILCCSSITSLLIG
jgi:hypothetical protein